MLKGNRMFFRSMRVVVWFALAAMWQLCALADLTVSNVEVFSGYPWQEVIIGYTISGSSSDARSLAVVAKDNLTGKTYAAETLTGASLKTGRHMMKWHASADGAKFKSSNVDVTVQILGDSSGVTEEDVYCIIDLSGGASATKYHVSYVSAAPAGGWSDEYKTTKLVMRRIEPLAFKMGSGKYQVTLTKPYYIGVFEVTQRQWELVMGTRPSYFNNDSYYGSRPVEKVSYNMIRGEVAGSGWPSDAMVDNTSFVGRIRERTRLQFDLPTEAEWECACRAGTSLDFNNGSSIYASSDGQDDNMDILGRYVRNGGYDKNRSFKQSGDCSTGTAKVGSYLPNSYGLYDMHGNVSELCLDWFGNLSAATDPVGAQSGTDRVIRGGSWDRVASQCTTTSRSYNAPSQLAYSTGFRLARMVQ